MSATAVKRTMPRAFRTTVANHGDVPAFRTADDSLSYTWAELRDEVDLLAGGLRTLGVEREVTVALMMSNRPEFHVADLAVMTAGGAPFSIYQTYTAEQVAYLLEDSGARIAIVASEYLEVVKAAAATVPDFQTIITVDGESGEGLTTWDELRSIDTDFDGEAATAEVSPDDLLTLIYTSGTTGPPKGVEITHSTMFPVVDSLVHFVDLKPGGRLISWLPAAHIAERGAHHYIPLVYGASVTCCPDPSQIVQFLPQVRPNWFFAVPRIWEKLKAGLEAMLAGQPDEQAEPIRSALADSVEAVRLRQRGEPVPEELAARVAEADETVFAGLRAMLGLDVVSTVSVGAAPTPVEVIEFFHAIGIEIAEIWGMSETSGVATMNPPGAVRIGTVGPALPGFEVELAEDGEVLVRGDFVMRGYRNKPEATAETIDSEGWLHTGDIGRFDEHRYLTIIDRKKEIIINAAGKNMSPANIEAAMKSSSPLIGMACVIGDARPYNTALLTLDPDVAMAWAAKAGLDGASLEEIATHPGLIAELEAAVEVGNAKLARVEQIKKFKLLAVEWPAGGDELTPTMKLKRKPIAAKYSREIEELYE
jgi:long-subunit acyl-CoA synthetase (AMP-forming)